MSWRVGVNLLWLVPGVVGGSEDATVRYLRALGQGHDDPEITLFVLPSFAAAHPDLAEMFPLAIAPVDGSSKPKRVAAESTWLPGAARSAGVSLVHHAGGVVPPLSKGPSTLTVHDLQPLDLPGNFGALKRAYLRASLRPSVRRAQLVVVPGEFTRGRVVERLGADPDHVVVVPWSVDPPAEEPDDSRSDDGPAAPWWPVPEGDRFVLYPAITYPHKNHAVLVDAFARLGDPHLHLVLPGGIGAAEGLVADRIRRHGLGDRVHRLGRIPRDHLDQLYRRATLVAVPSRYEGFGLPALEAMAHGRAVIAAGNTALGEVVVEGTPLLDPDDVAGWAEAIRSLADDPARRAACEASGRVHAASFSSERTASAMVGAWRRAIGRTEPTLTRHDPLETSPDQRPTEGPPTP